MRVFKSSMGLDSSWTSEPRVVLAMTADGIATRYPKTFQASYKPTEANAHSMQRSIDRPDNFQIASGSLEHGLHEPTVWIGWILSSGPRLHLQSQVHGSLHPNGNSNVIGRFGYFVWERLVGDMGTARSCSWPYLSPV